MTKDKEWVYTDRVWLDPICSDPDFVAFVSLYTSHKNLEIASKYP